MIDRLIKRFIVDMLPNTRRLQTLLERSIESGDLTERKMRLLNQINTIHQILLELSEQVNQKN